MGVKVCIYIAAISWFLRKFRFKKNMLDLYVCVFFVLELLRICLENCFSAAGVFVNTCQLITGVTFFVLYLKK